MRSIIRYDTPSALGSLEETACESALRSVSVRIGDVEGAIRTVVAAHQIATPKCSSNSSSSTFS